MWAEFHPAWGSALQEVDPNIAEVNHEVELFGERNAVSEHKFVINYVWEQIWPVRDIIWQ